MTGGTGCGKIEKLCKKLDRAFDEGLFIILTGRNEKLKAKLDSMFKENAKFQTVAFTPNVHFYLKAADCVLSKSGGLSSTEIAVANVPLIHMKAIPGLETANLKYFSKNGLSLSANTVREAVNHIRQLLSENSYTEAILAIQRFYIKADATERITEGMRNERTYLGVFNSRRLSDGEYNVLQDYPQVVSA